MLDINELMELEEPIKRVLLDNYEETIIRLNRTGELEELLRLLNLQELIGLERDTTLAQVGKIIVIGKSDVEREKLAAVAKNMGIDRNRFEFFLDYNDAKTFDFRKTQWSSKYSAILVGEMPHSGHAKEECGSIISALEQKEGYPPVLRVGTSGINITKSSFRDALNQLIEKHIVSVA